MSELRPDLSIIQQWIRPESEILDLGCGEGELLSYRLRKRSRLWSGD